MALQGTQRFGGRTWLVGLVMTASLVAGCAGIEPEEGDLRTSAAWQPWHDDPFPHLVLSLTNMGGSDVKVGPGGMVVSIESPSVKTVRVEWGETPFARSVHSGSTVVVALHPRLGDDGSALVLAIDHAWGVPAMPEPGYYEVCVGTSCSTAILQGP